MFEYIDFRPVDSGYSPLPDDEHHEMLLVDSSVEEPLREGPAEVNILEKE